MTISFGTLSLDRYDLVILFPKYFITGVNQLKGIFEWPIG
jgi:hypothetical protein